MIKRVAALARGISEDPVVMGMLGLFLLGRCLDGLTERAGQVSERLGQVQVLAQETLAAGQAVAVQVDAATTAAAHGTRAATARARARADNGDQAAAEAPAEVPET
jgi:F0F1-type ATP synthase membrane subunit b/b'